MTIWSLIAFGIGLWMFMEGLVIGILPGFVRYILAQIDQMSDEEVRTIGLCSAGVGLVLIYLTVGF